MWEDQTEKLKRKYLPSTKAERAQQLLDEADALDREADRMEGTFWAGDMSPSTAARLRASEKREHAMLLKINSKN